MSRCIFITLETREALDRLRKECRERNDREAYREGVLRLLGPVKGERLLRGEGHVRVHPEGI